MNRRHFLTGMALLPTLSLPSLLAHANTADLSFGIFPATGTADLPLDELRAAIMPSPRQWPARWASSPS